MRASIKRVERDSGQYRRQLGGDTERRVAEQRLIERCCAGDSAAQRELYDLHRRQVTAALYRVMNDRTDLDDLVQEVFAIAFRGLPRFRGDAKLSTWLHRICINVALGRIRSKKRRPPPRLMEQPVVENIANSPETPERAMQRTQAKERVRRILDAMPEKKRVVLQLHEIEGLDLKQIAYIVGANPVTVRTRLFYARKEFYKRAAAEGEP